MYSHVLPCLRLADSWVVAEAHKTWPTLFHGGGLLGLLDEVEIFSWGYYPPISPGTFLAASYHVSGSSFIP
jgi:hypothetical protein